jgi:hypothetical protein
MNRFRGGLLLVVLSLALVPSLVHADGTFLGGFSQVRQVASTVPANGDVNPYGVAVVPASIGKEIQGNILVSNFNNRANLQGTGTTIVQVSPSGSASLFARINPSKVPCPGGVGLTTALVILTGGWVVVGSLPTTDGMADTARAGCLLVLDNAGRVVETFRGGDINGPWDMTATSDADSATLYVTNVLNGTVAAAGATVDRGTVVRLRLGLGGDEQIPQLLSSTVIGSGFPERTDPNALVIGPTGVALDSEHTLVVADSLDNRIAVIGNPSGRTTSAGTGDTLSSGGYLNDPLGLTVAPNGRIITANGNDGLLVETTPDGAQVAHVDTGLGGGSLFGIAVAPGGNGLYLVDDGTNHLDLLS